MADRTRAALTRRRFLATSALAAPAAAALPATALGFSVEPADAETSAIYLNACSADAYHAQLLADVKAALAGEASEAEIDRAVALVTCPLCGCPVG